MTDHQTEGDQDRPRSMPASNSSALENAARDRRLVAIIVPQHRFPLTEYERISLRHLRAYLGRFDRYIVGPHVPPDEFFDFSFVPFSERYFVDRGAYNHLMESECFYRAFLDYEYILIYQLDALVFSSDLEEWCRKGWDYVGAPWFRVSYRRPFPELDRSEDPVDRYGTVGNGGLSLRRVDSALAVLAIINQVSEDWMRRALRGNEDMFWSFGAPQILKDFRIATPREALAFAFETELQYCYQQNSHRLPFGCHGWEKWEPAFWKPFLLTDD